VPQSPTRGNQPRHHILPLGRRSFRRFEFGVLPVFQTAQPPGGDRRGPSRPQSARESADVLREPAAGSQRDVLPAREQFAVGFSEFERLVSYKQLHLILQRVGGQVPHQRDPLRSFPPPHGFQ